MTKLPKINKKLASKVSIKEAAIILGVSTKTLRRWEENGLLKSNRTAGGHRRYDISEVKAFKKYRKRLGIERRLRQGQSIETRTKSDYLASPTIFTDSKKITPTEVFSFFKGSPKRYKISLIGSFLVLIIALLAAVNLEPGFVSKNKSISGSRIAISVKYAFNNLRNLYSSVAENNTIKDVQKPLVSDLFNEYLGGLVLAESTSLNNVVFNFSTKTIFQKDIEVNGSAISTTSGSFNLLNDNATSLNIGGTATAISLGAATGLTTINNNLAIGGTTLSSSGDLTIDAGGGGVKIGTGTPGSVDMTGDDLYITGDLEVDGSSYISTLVIGGDTFTDLTGTGLQVSSNTLQATLGTSIDSSEITDDTIKEVDLNASNSPTNAYLLSYNSSTGGFTWTADVVAAHGIDTVQESDVTINTVTATTLDFVGGDFDLLESPAGEVNIQLAAQLTTPTGVAGNFDIQGTLTAGTSDAFQVDANGTITIPATQTLTIGTTSLNEYTSASDSGAYLIRVFPEFANSSSTNVQAVLNDLDAAIGGVGGSKWTQASGFAYLTNLTDDLVIGGNTIASGSFYFDEDAGNLYLGTNGALDGVLTLYSSGSGTDPSLAADSSRNLIITSVNLNTTSTGINSTAIGATTVSTGAFSTLSSTGITTLASGAGSATTIGNTTGNFELVSNALDISTAGVISGATGVTSSGTITFSDLTTDGVVKVSSGTLSSEAQLAIARGGTGISSAPTSGQLLIGTASNEYTLSTLTEGTAIDITSVSGSITIANAGVTSLTGTTNRVTVSGSTGDITLSGPQDIHTGATPTFAAMTLSNTSNQLTLGTGNTITLSGAVPGASRTYTIPDFGSNDTFVGLAATQTLTNKSLSDATTYFRDNLDSSKIMQFQLSGISASTTRTLTVPNEDGTICLTTGNCAGTGAGIGGSGTTNTLTKFTSQYDVGDSSITDTGSLVTFSTDTDLSLAGSENLSITNSTLSSDLLSLTATIADTNSADAIQVLVTDNTSTSGTGRGLYIEVEDGSASLDSALAINHVDTTQALTAGISITGASSTAITTAIDVSDAEIGTALALGSNDVTVGGATISSTEFAILDSNISLTSEVTGILPTGNGGTGTASTPSNGQLLIGNGTGYTVANLIEGEGIDITNESGAITIAGELASYTNLGVASFSSTNFSVTSGAVNTIQNIATTSSPTFAAMTLSNTSSQLTLGTGNTITLSGAVPGASRTYTIPDFGSNDTFVGLAATQTLTNKSLSDATTYFIDNLDGTKRMQLQLSGVSAGTTRTLTVPNSDGEICLATGNCAGTGAGVGGSGTANTLTKFTNTYQVGDASITDTGSLVTFSTDIDLSLAGSENLAISNSSLSADLLSLSATIADTNSADAIQLSIIDNTSTSGTGRGLYIEVGDGSASLDSALAISHTDTGQALTTGISITGATSTAITTAIDVSDPEIATALSAGLNDLSGTNWSITGSSGNFTGGTYNSQTISSAASFTGTVQVATSLTSPVYTGSGEVTLSSGGGGALTLDSSSGIVILADGNLSSNNSIITIDSGSANRVSIGASDELTNSTWTISGAGAVSGITTISASGAITAAAEETINGIDISSGTVSDVVNLTINAGGDLTIGTVGLNDTGIGTGPTAAGASLVGVYYTELTYSSSSNVQDVLDDLDAAISASLYTFDVSDGSTSQTINDADILTFADSSNINATVSATDTVTMNVIANSLDFTEFQNTLDLDTALTLNQTTNTWGQTYTGTTSTGFSYTANSLTTGSALSLTAASSPTSSSSISNGATFNLTQSAGTNPTTYTGVDVLLTNNPTVSGNTEYGLRVQNQETSNTTDNAIAALMLLDNADTSTSGSTVVTDGLRVTASGAIADGVIDAIDVSDSNITNAINIGANAIAGTNFSVAAAGGITIASAQTLTIGTTSLNETTSASDTGAVLVGVYNGNFANAPSAVNVQEALDAFDNAIGSGASKWSTGSGFIYVTTVDNDVAIGGSTQAGASFYFEEAGGQLDLGTDSALAGTLRLFSATGATSDPTISGGTGGELVLNPGSAGVLIAQNGTLLFEGSSDDGNETTLTPVNPTGDRSINIPNNSGTMAVAATSPIVLGADGTISCPTCLESGGSGSSKWSIGTYTTYLTDANSDINVGATDTLAAPFSVDVSANLVRIGDGVSDANTPTLAFYASNASSTGSLLYTDSDQFDFTGGDLLIDQSLSLPSYSLTASGSREAQTTTFAPTVGSQSLYGYNLNITNNPNSVADTSYGYYVTLNDSGSQANSVYGGYFDVTTANSSDTAYGLAAQGDTADILLLGGNVNSNNVGITINSGSANSVSLGASDALNISGNFAQTGATTFSTGTGAISINGNTTFASGTTITQNGTGQVSLGGNVDVTSGLDVTGANFTVGTSNFTVAPATGNTTIAGTLGVTGLITASGGLTLPANQNLTLSSGTGTITQTYSNTTGSASTFNVTDSSASGTSTVNGLNLALAGTVTTGTNTINGLRLTDVTSQSNNTFTAISIGDNYNNLLQYENGGFTGTIQGAGLSGNQTYTLPNSSGTICLSSNNCTYVSSFTVAGESGNNQTITSNDTLAISAGTGIDTVGGAVGSDILTISVQADSLDFTEFQDVLDLDASLTLNQGTSTWTQNYSGTGTAQTLSLSSTGTGLNVTSSSTGTLLSLTSTGTGTTPTALSIANTSTGAITTAIDVSDAEIGTALAIGSNDVTVGGATISSTEFAILDSNISLTSEVTGILPIANGGTGATSTPTNGQLLIGNGTGYAVANLVQGTGMTITNNPGSITIANAGVTSLTGTTNRVTVSGSTGDITLSGPQDIHTGATPTFAAMTLSNTSNQLTLGTGNTITLSGAVPGASRTYTIPDFGSNDTFVGLAATQTLTNKSLSDATTYFRDNLDSSKIMQFQLSGISASTTRTLTVPNEDGTICLTTGNCAGTGAGIGGSGTTNTLTKFTSQYDVGDSSITDTGSLVTFSTDTDLSLAGSENLSITNSTLSSDLLSLTATIADTNSADAIQVLVTDNTSTSGTGRGLYIEVEDGSASLDSALAINHVDTTQALTAGISITGASSTAITTAIDVSDAEIGTALALGSNDVTVGGATISSTEFAILDSNISLTSEVTGILPTGNGGTGTASTPSNGQLLIGNGTGYTVANLIEGEGIDITNESGAITIAGELASYTNLGVASFSSTNFSVTSGAVNTIQNIATTSSPTFAAMTLSNTSSQLTLGTGNTITLSGAVPGASRTYTIPDFGSNDTFVGLAATQTLTNKSLSDATTYFRDNVDSTKVMQFELSGISTSTTRTLTVPNESGTLCLSTGNCVGSGAGIGGSGTVNTLTKFTSQYNVGDSSITDTGSLVTFSTDIDLGLAGSENLVLTNSSASTDQISVTASGVTADGADGVSIAFTQADDTDATDTNSALQIAVTSSSGDADTLYGLNIANISAGSATETAIYIGTGWDQAINAGGTSISLTELAILDNNINLTSEVTGTLPVGSGGTGATTLAQYGVLYGNATSAIGATTAGTNGQLLLGNTSAAPAFATMSGDATIAAGGALTISANAVALSTDTTGNYVGDVGGGSGITVTGTPGEGYTETVALGALTQNWNQTGGFDVILNSTSSELQILGSSGTYFGTLDTGALTGDKTYVLPNYTGASADICLSTGNCGGTVAGIGGSGTTNYVPRFTAQYTIGNSQIFDSGTYVGIGTTAPSKLLTIVGTQDTSALTPGATTVGIELSNTSSSTLPSRESTIAFSQYAGTDTSRYAAISGVITGSNSTQQIGDILFSTKAAVTDSTLTERMRISSTGYVGIGTTSPEGLLEVQGGDTVNAVLYLDADRGDDLTDTWILSSVANDNDFTLTNNTTELFSLSSLGVLTLAGLQTADITTQSNNALTLAPGGTGQFNINSANTTGNAINISATGSGGGMTFLTTDGYIDMTATGAVNGDISLLAGDDLDINASGAGSNINIGAAGGSQVIYIGNNGTTTDLNFDLGTSTLDIDSRITNADVVKIAAAAAVTAADGLNGFNLDLATNYTSDNADVDGVLVTLDTATNNTGSSTQLIRGLVLSGGALTTNAASAVTNWDGAEITIPAATLTAGTSMTLNGTEIITGNITQSAGAVTENGLLVDLSASDITTSGALNGINITGRSSETVGTITGVNIGNITAGTATETAINIGTNWDYGIYTNSNVGFADGTLLDLSGITHTNATAEGFKLPLLTSTANEPPTEGYIAYENEGGIKKPYYYNGTDWVDFSGASTTLQEAYTNDINDSDTLITLSGNDDSLIFRNPVATAGTDSNFVLQLDNIDTGRTDNNFKNLYLTNSGATFDTTSGNLTNYGAYIANTATDAGTQTLTNVGLYATASGGDTNYAAIFENGNVGIGDTTPDVKLEILSTTEQLRLTHTDGTVDARLSLDTNGDFTIDASSDGTGSETFTLTGFSTFNCVDCIDFDDLADALSLDTDTSIAAGTGEELTYNKTFTDATSENGLVLNFTASDTTSGTTAQYGLTLNNVASTEGLDAMLLLDNADTNDSVGDAIRITSGAGTILTGLDFDSTDIVTDIELQYGETIDNNTDNQVNIGLGTSGTLLLTSATASTIQNSAGPLTLNATTYTRVGDTASPDTATGDDSLFIEGNLEVDSDVDLDLTAGENFDITYVTTAPTADIISVTNSGLATTTDTVDGLALTFAQGVSGGSTITNYGINLSYTTTNDNVSSVGYGMNIDYTNSSSTGNQGLLQLINNDTAQNQITEFGLQIVNSEATANRITDYIRIAATTEDTTADAIDVSNSNLFNALNVGANTITGTSYNLGASTALVLGDAATGTNAATVAIYSSDWEVSTTGDLTGIGNITMGGRLDTAAHTNNTGLNLPTNAGAPIGVTGTAEGDVVYDTTGDALYVYNGASFAQIGGGTNPTLQQVYGYDDDGTDATISLTTADDSLVFTNPTSSGSDSAFLLHLNQQNTTAVMSALDITQASNAADAVNLTANALDTETILDISGTGLTSGYAINVALTENTLNGGYYLRAYDNSAAGAVFTIGEDGNTTIAGSGDGTDALTLTTGDIQITNGDLDVAAGDFNVGLDAGDTANFTKTGANAGDIVSIAGSSVNAVDGMDIALTSTADTGVDAYNGINFAWTESTDADTISAINIANTTATNSVATAISIGTGWDYDLVFADTSPTVRVADGGSITLEDNAAADGNNILVLADVSTANNHVFSIDSDTALSFDSNLNTDIDITTASNETLLILPNGSGDTLFNTDADSNVQITATAAPGVDMVAISNSGQATTTNLVAGLSTTFVQGNGAITNYGNLVLASTTNTSASYLFGLGASLTNDSTLGSQYIAGFTNENTGTNAITEAGIRILNDETTADTLTDYIIILKNNTGADTSADAIDVSDADLFNALNVGANTITGTSYTLEATTALVLGDAATGTNAATVAVYSSDWEISTTGDLTGIGNITMGGRLDTAAHTNNTGLNLPTNAGVPAGVTGTAEGDIVYDTTNDALYVYNGASFAQIGGNPTLQQVYGYDVDGTDATISLTTADDSLVFTNPTSSGSDSAFLLHLNQQNTTAVMSALDITQASNGANAVNITADSLNDDIGINLSVDGLTSGKGISITSTSTGFTSGNLFSSALSGNSAFTGNLNLFEYTGTSTATGDILRIHNGTGNVGNLFNVLDDTTSIFKVSETNITSALPHEFTAAGDVSVAYDIQFTNQASSFIKSNAPLTFEAGESFESNNLTFKTYNYGDIVLDPGTYGATVAAGPFSLDSQATFTDSDTTPDVSGGSHFITNTTTVTITDFDAGSGSLNAGQIIVIESAGAITYDFDAGLLNLGTADIVTAAGDITAWIYDGTDWNLISWMDDSDPQTGADIAEFFRSSENLQTGEIVKVDANNPLQVVKSDASYQFSSIGVVSTQPGMTIGEEGEGAYPIALAGRVPVKVTDINGPIQPGDPIASSSIPGVAMKATQSGQIIGTALEAWDVNSGRDTVTIFVKPTWHEPEGASFAEGGTVTDNDLTLMASFFSQDENGRNTLNIDNIRVTDLTVLGDALLGNTTISGKLNIGGITIDSIENSIDAIGTLKMQPMALGNIEMMGGLVTIDTEGNMVANEITAKKYNVSGASAGTSVITSGETSVFISTGAVTENSLIFVTPKTLTANLAVTAKSMGSGFRVEISEAATTDIEFDWLIVDKLGMSN